MRNLSASTPSLLEEAESRRQRVKLGGWSLLGVCVLMVLGKVVALMVGEVVGLFEGLSSAHVARERELVEQLEQSRDMSSITSDKVFLCL